MYWTQYTSWLFGHFSYRGRLSLYSTIVRKVRKSPCMQDAGRSVERIIIHAGILQNSREIHATFPATHQYRQISRANFSCVEIFSTEDRSLGTVHVDMFSLDCRLEAMSLIAE